jgi:hypothetical protein
VKWKTCVFLLVMGFFWAGCNLDDPEAVVNDQNAENQNQQAGNQNQQVENQNQHPDNQNQHPDNQNQQPGVEELPSEAFVHCAAAGLVTDGTYQLVHCTGPGEFAGHAAESDGMRLEIGAMNVVAP